MYCIDCHLLPMTDKKFTLQDEFFTGIRSEAEKLEFSVVITKLDYAY